MLFWIVAAAMTAGVLLLILPPLLRPAGAAPARAAYDIEVYRDQLTELDRDVERGLVTEAQAAAARAEIGRRMLTAGAESAPAAAAPPRRARALAVVLALAIPVGALAVYLPLGHPDLPAQPLASRDLDAERNAPPPAVLAAVDKLKAHLAAEPNDLQGWSVLGQTYARMGRWGDAADALRRAVGLSRGDLEVTAFYAEALTNANGGTVPEEARTAFDAILEKNPADPRARYYLALARFQAGDVKGALERWAAIVADTPEDAPWLPMVQARVTEAAGRLGLDVATVMPKPKPAEPPPAAQAGTTADQERMVRGMVESLAAKLEANPGDVDGWVRLARSYRVLGEMGNAETAARNAVERAPKRPDALLALVDVLLATAPPAEGRGTMPAEAVRLLKEVAALDPANRDALWLLGLDAANAGRKVEAAELWGRLLAQLDPKDPDHALLRQRLDALKAGG
ncbi:c-type cytochrome biogenesis protein CcmI [Azospirillum sp. RWY-5-1]|uniref:C-type cytochrome biogenesis protein CcmI n=1 Tax=Azospirillum oleiclasticum TaxID=2735135 RepID=A0ABX2TAM8_9PROT|nr:c-type cytochrome biogenesis protein CcmI [Azospirillum oleiclasticum]NYZ15338.1 c-type cytochrome biogenesis protein CcmI [Azospirillum oleiclasticum]NYZ21241.1 c-type cytochrome biogenesis protein CcmI [Azospirillum oleiclasticum]